MKTSAMPGLLTDSRLTEETALDAFNRAVAALPWEPPRQYEGRGIVICGGGAKYFPCSWVCINILRQRGCRLPIELWHLGPGELNDTMRGLIEPLGVVCVDAFAMRERYPARVMKGWELKSYAMLYSGFREILLLDSDNVAVVDPEFLFETPQFADTGAIFWPDFGRFPASRTVWGLTGVPYQDEPEFESGQIVLDKARCFRALTLANWFNQNSDFWYRHIHGDKDTFHMAWRKLGETYAMPRRKINRLLGTMCQHDFAGRRIFQHRNTDKWSIDGNLRVDDFLFEEDCLRLIEALRPHWSRIAAVNDTSA